jgi:hypothetical protein
VNFTDASWREGVHNTHYEVVDQFFGCADQVFEELRSVIGASHLLERRPVLVLGKFIYLRAKYAVLA